MSIKMECPGCGAYTSGVASAVRNAEPCPYCGLSTTAILEIGAIRQSKSDEALIRKTEEAVLSAARQEAEVAKTRRFMEAIRSALDEYDAPGD